MNTNIGVIVILLIVLCDKNEAYEMECSNLRLGQYICPHPDHLDYIDEKTQQPKGCTKENKAKGERITRTD